MYKYLLVLSLLISGCSYNEVPEYEEDSDFEVYFILSDTTSYGNPVTIKKTSDCFEYDELHDRYMVYYKNKLSYDVRRENVNGLLIKKKIW